MKKFSFLTLAAAGMLLGACSSNNEVNPKDPTQGDGDHFITIGINLPTVPVTRAASDNDGQTTLDDGLPKEYAVVDATLALFASDGTFKSAYNLATEPWTMIGDDKQVTESSKKIIQKVGGDVAVGDLALVILNKNSLVQISGTNLQVNKGGAWTDIAKFTDLYDATDPLVISESMIKDASGNYAPTMTANGFFMANAPLADKKGSSTTDDPTGAAVQVLVPINAVFPTEAEAQAATPAQVSQIYVERGMAKVTMRAKTDVAFTGTGMTSYTWSITGWTLDNTNTTSYLVRNTDGNTDFAKLKSNATGAFWRYTGNTEITTGSPATYKYRTYFAKDPNYNTAATLLRYTTPSTNGEFVNKYGDENPQYCYENTFDVDHQNEDQTTLAQIEITANTGGKDVYLIGGVKSVVYDNTTLEAKIKEVTLNYLKTNGLEDGTMGTTDITVTLPATSVAGNVDFGNDATKIKVEPLLSKIVGSLPSDFYTKVKDAIGGVVCYKGGKSYYTVRIKHFGDGTLTPWNSTETPKPKVGNVYPTSSDRDNNYLGRYGVLRNNWYDINITAIKYLGDATPQDPSTTTDDELDAYIAFQINVLSWAKRTQSWSF